MFLSFFFCFSSLSYSFFYPFSLCSSLPSLLIFSFYFLCISISLPSFPHVLFIRLSSLSVFLSLSVSVICLYLSFYLPISLFSLPPTPTLSLSLSLFPVLLLLIFPPSFCSCFSPAHEIQAALLPRARRGSSTITLKAASTRVLFLLTSASLHGLYEPLYTKCECLLFMVTHYLFA